MERGAEGVCLYRLEEMFDAFGPAADRIIEDGPEVIGTALILFHMFKMADSAGIPNPLLEKAAKILAGVMRLTTEEGSAEHPDQVGRCSVRNQPI